ncbi:TetR/AcrR family transcriptional regulator [Cellulomonas soli]|uniref:TetR family transcriptional regulator n=1 Tax=Cellulomonas soli TaxID=931535 RepID=A0A512PCF7_9CELL|nr:TetR/AcrR family transcriptional regulator [Cellulomonas soli]NYI58381.1 AcrR family transcriptional regulator [Cellulomonas soli]GEP68802.1 TetR family transcriptional regulator [Cellulomonas soli]
MSTDTAPGTEPAPSRVGGSPSPRVASGSAPGTVRSSARSGGYAKGRATRREIVDAATALFAEVGFHTASLREISARVGISHPGLLHHFPTKVALLEAVLARRDEVDGAALDRALAQGADLVESLVQIADRNAGRPHIVELFATLSAEATSPEHPAHAYFRRRYDDTIASFADGLEQWRARGTLRPGVDVVAAARTLVAVMDGLQIQWLLEADRGEDRVDMVGLLRLHLESYRRPA